VVGWRVLSGGVSIRQHHLGLELPTNQRRLLCSFLASALTALAACDADPNAPIDAPPQLAEVLEPQAATVGTLFDLDVRQTFIDQRQRGLTFIATFSPPNGGLSFAGGHVIGTPTMPGVVRARIVARDAAGDTVAQTVDVVAFRAGLTTPVLPPALFPYSDTRRPIPAQYLRVNAPGGAAVALSNVRLGNPTTDAGATLGRVLFHDTRLSSNDRVACASCHLAQFGFSDTARFSRGVAGVTARHSMALANARFYGNGRFFWDQRAATLEDQTLLPIQDQIEMGLTLVTLRLKLEATSFYAPLFDAAFGTSEITTVRIAQALAQYVRSIISYGSRFDSTFINQGPGPAPPGPNLARLTTQEVEGFNLYNGVGRCAQCHATNAHVSDAIHNTGLDSVTTDGGAGGGRFKAPSLRNAGVRGRFMHDGRFTSLEQVVDFYNSGVKANPQLDVRMRDTTGAPRRLRLTTTQRDALVAFLRTLNDRALMTDPRFANPFPPSPPPLPPPQQ
jgi:cytochrome c peroxidase